jgi:protein TonB
MTLSLPLTGSGIDRGDAARWAACLLVVLALHAGAAAGLMDWQSAAEQTPPPPAAIMLDLAPLPSPPASVSRETVPNAPEIVSAPPPPPVVEPEPEPELLPETPPAPAAVVTLPPPLPKPKPIERKPVERKPEERKIEPKPVPQQVERPPVPKTDPDPSPPAPAAAAPAAAAAASAASVSASAASATPPSTAMPSFQGVLLAHLQRYKRYPSEARARREQGVAYLRFIMDREGKIASFRLERSAGSSALDQEVLAMIKRAEPLPPIPPEISQVQLELIVPVQFSLR